MLYLLARLVEARAKEPRLGGRRICLFLGAGADISSGGLTFADLKRRAVEQIVGAPIFDITTEEEIERKFEDLFHNLAPGDRALLVDALFNRMRQLTPSDAYKLLVLLAEAGGIDAVVTTNFDIMLEEAQRLLGRDLFQVYAPGTARPDIRNNLRYELPKKPYLKLHGDLASRTVLQLTGDELSKNAYDHSVLDLLNSILQTHDLIIAGYGGFDTALTEVIAQSLLGRDNRIFWCSPRAPHPQSPLYRRLKDRIDHVAVSFDAMLTAIARPVLERPSNSYAQPTYLDCLLNWRIEYCNHEYRQLYGKLMGRSIDQVLVRRPVIEEKLAAFIGTNKPLAVLTGPSGFGKTTIGLRLERLWKDNEYIKLLLLRAKNFPDSGDIEQHIGEQLGGLGYQGIFSLYNFERWLTARSIQLIVYVDGVNEFSPDLPRCVAFLKGIIRFCYFMPESDSAIRIIATIRQESWNAMLPHLDIGQLGRVIWSGDQSATLSTIACNRFTDAELSDALGKLRGDRGKADLAQMSPSTIAMLRDPYFLRAAAEASTDGTALSANAGVYRDAFKKRIRQSGSLIREASIEAALSDLALTRLDDAQARFREIDIEPAALRSELVRLFKDLNILIDAGDGRLQFDHDRTFEYFLALGFRARGKPSLETADDLRLFLKRYRPENRPYAAARLYFQLYVNEAFPLITAGLKGSVTPGRLGSELDDPLFNFAREVLIQLAEWRDPTVVAYLREATRAFEGGGFSQRHLRTVVQAIATLPTDEAVPLLCRIEGERASLAGIEAYIYAIDKLAKFFLTNGALDVDLLEHEPYRTLFADAALPTWRKVGRLIGLAMQVGPDNSHPEEYAPLVRGMADALTEFVSSPDEADIAAALHDHFLKNCDRLLFNATPEGIQRFFDNPRRSNFLSLVDKLAAGAILSDEDFAIVEPYTQSLAADVEYHLVHVLFALSSLNDLEATLAMAERKFATFSNATSPEEVDFFQAVLVYLHILHDYPYDVRRFSGWEEIVLARWPDVLTYRPGLQRGERRGFSDVFDRVFEDGFGVIFQYGILAPSAKRRGISYEDYLDETASREPGPLPLYTGYLQAFLDGGRIVEALQVLQALASVIMVWPIEGLQALRPVIGHPDPKVRRAVVRILAEALNRRPEETIRFLVSAGVALSDEELVDIKIRKDARIGRRQINEEEWARLAHLLLRRMDGRETFIDCLRDLLTAESSLKAVQKILERLGFQAIR